MKRGFTLAEVLITLTIVGVIAALTIPNLMQKYKKHQVEVGIKAAYSIISNALNLAKAEHGDIQEMIDNAATKGNYQQVEIFFSENYVEPYLKFSKKLLPNNSSTKQIFADTRIKKVDGTTENTVLLDPPLMVQYALENGMALGVVRAGNTIIFVVDIDGAKGRNQSGHDVFYFSIETNSPKNRLIGGSDGTYLDPVAYYWTVTSNNCRANLFGGTHCVVPIMYNGWKIPDDYPVKKW